MHYSNRGSRCGPVSAIWLFLPCLSEADGYEFRKKLSNSSGITHCAWYILLSQIWQNQRTCMTKDTCMATRLKAEYSDPQFTGINHPMDEVHSVNATMAHLTYGPSHLWPISPMAHLTYGPSHLWPISPMTHLTIPSLPFIDSLQQARTF